jgi:glycosyltransferase involved in cell wall biosynthesis
MPSPSEIWHLLHHDSAGGAARAANLLHLGLLKAGADSNMLARESSGAIPKVEPFRAKMDWRSRFARRFRRGAVARRYAAFPAAAARGNDCLLSPPGSEYPDLPGQIPADAVINLHWVAGCIDAPTFFRKAAGRNRLVWTLHDMWPLTGACHYSTGCERFTGQCGACHQILSQDETDITRQTWLDKQRGYAALRDDQLTVVSPSRWLADCARRSSLLGRFDIRVIPYGIDTAAFAPRDPGFCRDTLGVPRDRFVIGFGAASVTSKRKGFSVLLKALEALPDKSRLHLVSVGRGKPAFPEGIPATHCGSINNDRMLSVFYSAADLFVLPTMEDNLPLTALESLACGTPVLGSDVGGVTDMARPGSTGFLFPPGDATALSRTLGELLADPSVLRPMRTVCRRVAETEYALDVQARNYLSLYEQLPALP